MIKYKSKKIEFVKEELCNKLKHLTLIKFKGRAKICIFYDDEFGFFNGIYRDVLRLRKNIQKDLK